MSFSGWIQRQSHNFRVRGPVFGKDIVYLRICLERVQSGRCSLRTIPINHGFVHTRIFSIHRFVLYTFHAGIKIAPASFAPASLQLTRLIVDPASALLAWGYRGAGLIYCRVAEGSERPVVSVSRVSVSRHSFRAFLGPCLNGKRKCPKKCSALLTSI